VQVAHIRTHRNALVVSHCILEVRQADFLAALKITVSETEVPTQDRMLYVVIPQYSHCSL
jgi:hypothetical protein